MVTEISDEARRYFSGGFWTPEKCTDGKNNALVELKIFRYRKEG
jgi:hypothetical protein